MHATDFPTGSDFEPGPDDFLLALEHNPLARWWRTRAGTSGETGARVIPWVRPILEPDPTDRPETTDTIGETATDG